MSLRDLIHQQWLAQQKANQDSAQQGKDKPVAQEPKDKAEQKDGDKQ